MTQHTEGPWSYRPDEYDDWGIVRAPVTEQGRFRGGIICQAKNPEALDELTLGKHREAGTDPWEANARLIAAAPELLDALEEVAAAMRRYEMDVDADAPAEHREMMRKADAAIAKARNT